MAYGKTYRRKYPTKKRKVTRGTRTKKLYRRNANPIIKSAPFPNNLLAKCKYVNQRVMTASATALNTGTEQTYRLSSIYDPNYTGTGVTVVGHAQFLALYERYFIQGVNVEIEFTNPSSDVRCYVSLNQDTNLAAKPDYDNIDNMQVYYKDIDVSSNGKCKFKLRNIKPWNLLRMSKLEYMANRSIYSSALTTNPANDTWLRTAVSGPTGNETCNMTITIEYVTEFYDRLQLQAT